MIKNYILWITLGFFSYLEPVTGQISCYQCNVDSSSIFTHDCTDPYLPTPLNHLLPCPEDEPHQCMKAIIVYNHNDITVRGCVPSRLRGTYCLNNNLLRYPGAKVNCTFCDTEACNRSNRQVKPFYDLVLGLVTFVAVNFQGIIYGS